VLIFWIILAAVLGLSAWLGPIIVQDIREKKAVKAAVDSLSEDKKAELFRLIETAGNAPSKGVIGLLVPDDLDQAQIAIVLPSNAPDYPWSEKLLTVAPAFDRKNWPWPPINFSITDFAGSSVPSRYRVDRYCTIPAFQRANAKKASSVFSVERMLQLSPQLREQAVSIHPENPHRFLAALLSPNGKWEHRNGYDQVRLGLSAQYLQEYRHHKCTQCNRPLKLIIQMPGAMVHRRLGDGTAYLFGCPSHPDITVTDYDMT
jgi:hypothetical protein